MSPLHERLAELRARVRQLLWLYGICWFTAVLLGTVLLVGSLDWWLHLDDAGVRLILGLSILGVSGFVAYRQLITPLRVPMSDLDLALRIERRFPKFRDSLASTIQFLQENQDRRLGAPELQQRVIDKTLKQAKMVEFEDVLQTQPIQRIGWTALVVCITTLLIAGLNRAEAATALKRLVFPFGSHPWPRQIHLQFVDQELHPLIADPLNPLRIARGDTFELTAINLNHKRLPNDVQLEFKHPNGSISREPMQRTTLRAGDQPNREAAFASLVIKSPFQFRAIGGDDETMEWFSLEVVPPPVTESLQVRLVPPKYSRQPAVKLPAGVGHVEGLVGTRVEVVAMSNKPLSSALLKIRDKDQVPVTIAADGRRLTSAFTIKEAGVYSYWIDLRDQQNFGNSDAPRYEIRAIQDSPPDIYIDRPATDIQVTANADVPFRLVAKDDLGLREIRLRYQILEVGKTELTKPVEMPLVTLDKHPMRHTEDYVWSLEPLKLTAGTQVQVHAEATDEYDLGQPHVGRSLTRTLTVVTPEDKHQELADRQMALLSDLERVQKQEIQIEAQTAELRTQLEKAGTLRPQDVDLLQRIEGQQRQLTTSLQNPQDGMLSRSQEILNEFRQNHVDAPETEQRLTQIGQELQRLADDHLAEIEQNLTQARKQVGGSTEKDESSSTTPSGAKPADRDKTAPKTKPGESPGNSPRPENTKTDKGVPGPAKPATDNPQLEHPKADQPDAAKPAAVKPEERKLDPLRSGASPTEKVLHQAQQHQRAVSDSLGDLLQELSQWQDERQAALDLQEIRQAQDKINKDTAELGKETVTKMLQDLKPQEQADLARQEERQQHEAEQLEQLQRRVSDIVKKLQEEDPAAAERMQEALEQLQQNNTVGKMRDAARQVGENNIGQAAQTQQKVAEELHAVEDALKNRPSSDLETMVKQMRQTEEELKSLFEDQEELIKKTEEAEKLTDPQAREEQLESLKNEQAELQKKAEQLARKLQRMQVKEAGESAQRAAERMANALEKLKKEGDEARKQEQEALDDIEQAQRELAQERQQLEEQLAFEQLEKVADQIAALMERQQAVLDETKRLDEAQTALGNWTRGQLKTLRDLAQTQRDVQQETLKIAEQLTAAEVFALAVKGAARQMEQAARGLDERQTGQPTQRKEQAAVQRFKDLAEALMQEESVAGAQQADQPGGKGGNGGGAGEAQPSGPQVDMIAMLSQLKMLRALQAELNGHLLELAAKRDTGNPLNAAELEELKSIGEEQGELAELAAKFLQMFGATPETSIEDMTLPPDQQNPKD